MSLLTNLISHWKLDETSGSRADSAGTNTLLDNNTVGSTIGKIGNAASFVAVNSQFLSITDNDSLSTGDIDFTLACWAKFNDLSALRPILQKGFDDAYGEFLLFYNVGNNDFRFYIANDSGGTRVFSSASPSTGTWFFFVVWYDSVNDQIGMQVNNGTIDTTSYAGGNISTPGSFKLGVQGAAFHDGLIDSVSMWKRILTSQEKTDLYNSGNGLDYPFGATSNRRRIILI